MLRRRYTAETGRTLHHQQGTFYTWTGTHYREADREEVRSVIYEFLDGAQRFSGRIRRLVPFNPTRSKVGDVLEALAAAAQLPGTTLRAPAWLDDQAQFAATEILPCANGLLHLPTRTLVPHSPAFFGVNAVDYTYEARAKPPTAWLAFLKSIWEDDQESIDTPSRKRLAFC